MSKFMQLFLFVGLFVFAASVQAGVTLSTTVSINSAGNDIAVITAISDGAPITSLGINIVGDGNIGQVHPAGFDTPLQDYNAFFGATPVDHDTQALFATAADNLLVVAGSVDSSDLMSVNFTGFAPFQSRAVAQVVATGGECVCEIGVVAGGVEYTLIAEAQGANGGVCVPEPASMGLLVVGCVALIRRR